MSIKQLLTRSLRLHPRLRLRCPLVAVAVPFGGRSNLTLIPAVWPFSNYPHLRHFTIQSDNTVNVRCPECGVDSNLSSIDHSSPSSQSICQGCASFLPLTVAGSHFSLFGLPKSYRLDPRALRLQYHRWQQLVHPDLMAARQNSSLPQTNRSDLHQISQAELASQWSILVNQARATLEDDVKRAAYMLELDGRLSMPDESGDNSVDPNLLMTLMESHEQLEEAETEVEVNEIRRVNKEMMRETILELEQIWDSDSQLHIEKLERARALAIKLRYLETIDNNCREWRSPIT
ncbi:hypothetical protein DFH28DRAFT_1123994 [Melampsora americana]|nr:hypothetical protein DFH28DRAFT_1123994 [Melampsora americana]